MKNFTAACRTSFSAYLGVISSKHVPPQSGHPFSHRNIFVESLIDLLANNLVIGRYLIGQLLFQVLNHHVLSCLSVLLIALKYYGEALHSCSPHKRLTVRNEARQVFQAYVKCVMGNNPSKSTRKISNLKGLLIQELKKFPEFYDAYNTREKLMKDAFKIGERARQNVSLIFVLPESPKTILVNNKLHHEYEGKYVVITPGM
jgi:hypothetical protein